MDPAREVMLAFEQNGEPLPVFLLTGTIVALALSLYLARHNNLATPMTCVVLFGGMMGDDALAPPGEADPARWVRTNSGAEVEAFFFGKALDRMADDEPAMLRATFEGYADASLACAARKMQHDL